MKKNFYITTTLPYVNAKPHIGFALEIIQADVLARYHAMLGDKVFFNTGTDEHGLKIYRNALKTGKNPQEYADEYAAKFRNLKEGLGLWQGLTFIRTTDAGHKKAAQHFWELCMKNGDIEKRKYQVSYCVGCELEKTDSELVDGHCTVHPNLKIEFIDEENYFFLFSKYQKKLLELYAARPDFVVPDYRFNEIKNFVESGLKDFSISRLKEKMPWGVEVPGDPEQVMYVWFDALINYISTLGWPDMSGDFASFWPGIQVAGKDNLRQQSAMWQAMLISAGVENSKQIFIHGFITSEGQKMSKSLGNVVDPFEIADTYGLDPLRYYLLGAVPAHDDGDFSTRRFEEFYTAHLVNGVGNLTSRILTMIEKYSDSKIPERAGDCFGLKQFWAEYDKDIASYQFDKIIEAIKILVSCCDESISEQKPWVRVKAGENIQGFLYQLVETLRHIAFALLPVIPGTAQNIFSQLGLSAETRGPLEEEQKWGGLSPGSAIRKGGILFERLP